LLLLSSAQATKYVHLNMRLYCEKGNGLSLMHGYEIEDAWEICSVTNHAKCLVSTAQELHITMKSCAEQKRQCPQIPNCDGIRVSPDGSLGSAMENGFFWVRKDSMISGEVDDFGGQQGMKVRLENGEIANREVLTEHKDLAKTIVRTSIIVIIIVIVAMV
ncbi:hypothetical protein PMAYCL1PPCAC_25083, partial [Pristionchus mayeri]